MLNICMSSKPPRPIHGGKTCQGLLGAQVPGLALEVPQAHCTRREESPGKHWLTLLGSGCV